MQHKNGKSTGPCTRPEGYVVHARQHSQGAQHPAHPQYPSGFHIVGSRGGTCPEPLCLAQDSQCPITPYPAHLPNHGVLQQCRSGSIQATCSSAAAAAASAAWRGMRLHKAVVVQATRIGSRRHSSVVGGIHVFLLSMQRAACCRLRLLCICRCPLNLRRGGQTGDQARSASRCQRCKLERWRGGRTQSRCTASQAPRLPTSSSSSSQLQQPFHQHFAMCPWLWHTVMGPCFAGISAPPSTPRSSPPWRCRPRHQRLGTAQTPL